MPVDGSQSGYLKSVCDYVHLNPERAGLLRPEQPLQTYLWSSYPLYLRQPSSRPAWLRVDRLLGEWGIAWDRPGAADQFAALMEGRRQAEREQQFKPVELRPDWCLGSEQFQKEMLAYVEQNRGQWHYGPELNQSAEAKAERLVVQALAARGVSEDHLMVWRKGHPFKIELAAKLRTETTVTLSWIAQRLAMGTRGHLAHLLYVHQHCPTEDGPAEQPGLEI